MKYVSVILTVLGFVFLWDFSSPALGEDGHAQLTGVETVSVLDAPKNFATLAKKLGFNRVEAVRLDQLDYVAYLVFVPRNSSREKVAQSLVVAFPNAIVE